jgi:hypothetical protein
MARPPHKEGPFHLEREREEMCFRGCANEEVGRKKEEIRLTK